MPRRTTSLLPDSLQARYLLVATIFIILVIVAAWWSSHYAHRVQNQSSSQLLIKNQSSRMIQNIRFSLWEANQALQEFMVTPSASQKDNMDSAIKRAHLHIDSLRKLFDAEHPQWAELTDNIDDRASRLQAVLNELATIRQDHALLHPASTTMNEIMLPMNTTFHTAVSLALNQLSQADKTGDARLDRLLESIKDNWITMIGEFRVFIANRFGAFSTPDEGSTLTTQQKNIELYYQQVTDGLEVLEALGENGKLDIQTEASLSEMRLASEQWLAGYQQVARLYHTDQWRTDIPFLRKQVQPEVDYLWDLLAELELSIESSSAKEVALYGTLANAVTNILWLFSVLAFLIAALGYFALQRMVISPLTGLSSALSDEASGKRYKTMLPENNVVEVRSLIHAFRNMCEKVHERTDDLQHKAHSDSLTGLPNRLMMEKRLAEALLDARARNSHVSLMVIDFDRFKEINDQHGHHTGDEFLRIIGQRFMTATRKNEIVARIGGDEFGVILPDCTKDDALHIASRLLEQICKPCTIDGISLPVMMSIGISIYPQHGIDADELFRHADEAMYQAKRQDKGIAVYDGKVVNLKG